MELCAKLSETLCDLKMKKKTLLLLLLSSLTFAQNKVESQQLLWYGYYNQLKFNSNWTLHSEIQERQFYNPAAQHQLVFRSNLDRKLIDNINGSVGMVLFLQSPNNPESKSKLIVPELRPDIGFNSKKKYSFFSINHRYKLEARFFHQTENNELKGGFIFSNFRFRYQLGFDFPLVKKEKEEKLIFKIKDEVMFNAGSKIIKNVFDQNRIYTALNYKFDKNFSIELGYMNWFQQKTTGNEFYDRNIIRFSIFHNIDLSK